MSKNIKLDNLNGDWIVHNQNNEKYWTRGNYELVHSNNIFNTESNGWIIKQISGLEILGLKTDGDPWQSDVEIIWNPNVIYTEDNINDFQVIAILDSDVIDISSYYECIQVNENGTWNGKKVLIRKDTVSGEIQKFYSEQIRNNLISQGLQVFVGNIYNIDATAQVFVYPEIGINTIISEQKAATASDILNGKQVFVNNQKIVGNMPIVLPEINNNVISISSGYMQTTSLPININDVQFTSSLNSNNINIVIPFSETSSSSSESQQFWIVSKGYLKDDYVLPIVVPKIEENIVIIDKDGYIEQQEVNIPIVKTSTNLNKTTVSEGYLPESITYITDTSFINATSSDILKDKVSIDKDGNRIVGNYSINYTSPVKKDKYCVIESGYLEFKVTYPDWSNVTIAASDVSKDKWFINSSGEWQQGLVAMASHKFENNKLSIFAGNIYNTGFELQLNDDINFVSSLTSSLDNNYIINIDIQSLDINSINPSIIGNQYRISIPKGFLKEGYVHNINVISPILENNYIIIAKGYLNEKIEIPISNISVKEDEIKIPVGYILEQQIFDLKRLAGTDTTTDNPATESDILNGKQAFVNGKKVVGNINTVTLKMDDINVITVQSGYINSASIKLQSNVDFKSSFDNNVVYFQVLQMDVLSITPTFTDEYYKISIPKGYLKNTYDYNVNIAVSSFDNNKLMISQGYIKQSEFTLQSNVDFISSFDNNVITIQVEQVDTMIEKIEEGKYIITVPKGYVNNDLVHSIDVSTPEIEEVREDSQVTYIMKVPAGYVMSDFNKSIIVNVNNDDSVDWSKVTATSEAVLKDYCFYNKYGNLEIGAIDTVFPYINENENIVRMKKGYSDNGFSLPITINNNISFESSLNNNTIEIEISESEYSVNIDNNSCVIQVSKGYLREDYIHNIDVYDSSFEINPSVLQQTLDTKDKYLRENLIIKKVTNQIDSFIQSENIREGVTILGVQGSLPVNADVAFGYIDENGLFQEMDLSSEKMVVDQSKAVEIDNVQMFKLPENIEQPNYIGELNNNVKVFKLLRVHRIENNLAYGFQAVEYDNGNNFWTLDEIQQQCAIIQTNIVVQINKVYVVFQNKIINGTVGNYGEN